MPNSKTIDGVNMKGLQVFLEQITNAGIDIKRTSHLEDKYFKKSIKDPYLDILISNIEARFDDKLLLISSILLNYHTFPTVCVLRFSKPLLNMAILMLKLELISSKVLLLTLLNALRNGSSFRQVLKENCNGLKQREVISKLCCDSSWTVICPNMVTLAQICQVVSIQTADVERIFLN